MQQAVYQLEKEHSALIFLLSVNFFLVEPFGAMLDFLSLQTVCTVFD